MTEIKSHPILVEWLATAASMGSNIEELSFNGGYEWSIHPDAIPCRCVPSGKLASISFCRGHPFGAVVRGEGQRLTGYSFEIASDRKPSRVPGRKERGSRCRIVIRDWPNGALPGLYLTLLLGEDGNIRISQIGGWSFSGSLRECIVNNLNEGLKVYRQITETFELSLPSAFPRIEAKARDDRLVITPVE